MNIIISKKIKIIYVILVLVFISNRNSLCYSAENEKNYNTNKGLSKKKISKQKSENNEIASKKSKNLGTINIGGHFGFTGLSTFKLVSPDKESIKSSMYGGVSFYLEWHSPFYFGIGYKFIALSTYPAYISMEYVPQETDSMGHYFYTAQLDFPAIDYLKNFQGFFLFGYSQNSYYIRNRLNQKGKEKWGDDPGYGADQDEDFDREIVDGSAYIYELNTEYSIGSHGFRLSLFYLVTEFEKFDNGIKPDGDGYGYYLSYRYGFSL